MTSPDGVPWTSRTLAKGTALRAIAYGNNQFVAVGDTIVTSPDGLTWTSRTSGPSNSLSGVAYGNNQFVAVGYQGTIVTSPDGLNRTNRTSGTGSYLSGVAYGNNQFVAVGGSGKSYQPSAIVVSPDGLTWTGGSLTDNPLLGIAYGKNQFVTVDSYGTIWTLPDGLTWTKDTSGTLIPVNLAYGNNTFVAVGGDGSILQSGVVGPVQPVLGPVVLLPNGAAQVTLTGLAGQTYPIQASTDLTDWLNLFNVALTTTSGQFVDTAATNYPRRFYRAVTP